MKKKYDAIIIGAGQAAPSLAVHFANLGQSIALVEANRLGGTCVNLGCTPTKTLRKSARVAHLVRHSKEFGITTDGFNVDFAAAMARMHERVNSSRQGLENWINSFNTIDVIHGWAQFEGRQGNDFIIKAGDNTLMTSRVYLNTGTRPFVPPITGMADTPYLDNEGLLSLTECPRHLIIIGGSYIGLEMGQIFCRLGAAVTIIEPGSRVASREDEDISAAVQDVLAAEGITILTGSDITRVHSEQNDVAVTLNSGQQVVGSHLLVATGRIANTDQLNLASIGLACDERGFIPTDSQLKTLVDGVWALGDVNRRGAFTHTSYHDHEIVIAHENSKSQPLHQWGGADRRPPSYAMFTDPPLGRVGISLQEAKALVSRGRSIGVATRQMKDISRAKEESETAGLIRLIVDADTEQILGSSMLGIGCDEVIAVISNFMATGASYRVMQQALPVHPTVAELLPTILSSLTPLDS